MLGVVFVHGVRSAARMWDPFGSLISGDEQLSRIAAEPVPRFEYATGIWRSSFKPLTVIPSVSTAADSLKEYLATDAGAFDRLVLIGHSQGGLVIQRCLARMLAEGRGLELARIRRVVLLATPNTGSQLLLTARRALVRRNPQERSLRPFDELVADTLRVVQRDIVHAPAAPTERSCRIPFSVYAGESDKVVTRASAQAVFPDAAVLPGDHFTIAKPDSPSHRTHATVRRLLLHAADDTDPDPPANADCADTVTTLGPGRLEVHNAVDAGAAHPDRARELTAYLPRAHDRRLRAVLAEVMAGGRSRLVMLTGESSIGKTRALYESLVEVAPHAPLAHPVGAGDLIGILRAGLVRPGSVVWLNEAQRFLYGPDGREAAERLHATLVATTGIAVLGTLWNDPYWHQLTAVGTAVDLNHDAARGLLTHQPEVTVRIDVPAHLSPEDMNAWRELAEASGDRRLRQALNAGAGTRRVMQHLSGGPDLLAAYLAGEQGGWLFTAAEHALVTAALDARRLGHHGPLPAVLLAAAADGNLAAEHRSADPDWADHALQALSSGKRADGTRADVRNTLKALTAVHARSGAPAAYEPSDYLDQHTRHLRADHYGTPALWNALIEHTADSDDQIRLAWAAWRRGLRTTAVRLWHKAITAGRPSVGFAHLGSVLDPGWHAAVYSAAHADLRDPITAEQLLGELHRAGATQAVAVLADRAATDVDLGAPYATGSLLWALSGVGAQRAVSVLAGRAAAHADVADANVAAQLLGDLRRAGAEQAVADLLRRDPAAHADLTDPDAVARLLVELRDAGAGQSVADLLGRDPAVYADLADPDATARLLKRLWEFGAERAVAVLAHRAAAQADVTDPKATAKLLRELLGAGAGQAVADLLERDPAGHADPTDPDAVAWLLAELREAGAEPAVMVLAERAAAHADVTAPDGAARLLRELRKVGTEQAATILAARSAAHADLTDRAQLTDPSAAARLLGDLQRAGAESAIADLVGGDLAARADLADSHAVASLLGELHRVGAGQQVLVLAERAAAHAGLTDPHALATLLRELRAVGAERAVLTLAERAVAHADLIDADAVARLLGELRGVEAAEAVAGLLRRGPVLHADLADPEAVTRLLQELRAVGADQDAVELDRRAENAGAFPHRFEPYGREPDGRPSPPWTARSIAAL